MNNQLQPTLLLYILISKISCFKIEIEINYSKHGKVTGNSTNYCNDHNFLDTSHMEKRRDQDTKPGCY